MSSKLHYFNNGGVVVLRWSKCFIVFLKTNEKSCLFLKAKLREITKKHLRFFALDFLYYIFSKLIKKVTIKKAMFLELKC